MINAWWLIPAIMLGALIGFFAACLMTTASDAETDVRHDKEKK